MNGELSLYSANGRAPMAMTIVSPSTVLIQMGTMNRPIADGQASGNRRTTSKVRYGMSMVVSVCNSRIGQTDLAFRITRFMTGYIDTDGLWKERLQNR